MFYLNNRFYIYRKFQLARLCLCGVFLVLLTLSCDSLFDVHPYDVHIKGDHDINRTNIAKIESLCENRDTVRVAFISDNHNWYTETEAEIADINKRNDIDFVIHCGDLTDTGTTQEFIWARDMLATLRVPYVALIGNHDFLGTGDEAYDYIYGEKNFSLIAGRVKFMCLDTNATEYDFMAAVPNFDYIETMAVQDTTRFDRTIVVMHSPPYSDQFNNNVAKVFRHYLNLMPGLMCCVYGHNHRNTAGDIFADGLMFYGIDCSQHRNYRIFTITPDGYEETLVDY